MFLSGYIGSVEHTINLATVLDICNVGTSIFVTYHTGEFEEFNGVVTDVKTVLFSRYDDSEIAANYYREFKAAVHSNANYFSFVPDSLKF